MLCSATSMIMLRLSANDDGVNTITVEPMTNTTSRTILLRVADGNEARL